MKIYILTAVHNGLGYTKKLIKSIYSQTYKNYEIVLVDDGSIDGTNDFLKKYPEIDVLKGNGKLWWTGSLNLGLKEILSKARGDDYVWIINNDCFFGKSFLRNLYNFAIKQKDKCIIGSTVVDAKTKEVIDNGVKIDWQNLKFSGNGTDALSTKGTLYPVKLFKEIGLFDAKHFPHYFSDYEFSIRAKKSGCELKVFKDGVIYNYSKHTGSEKIGFSKKSKLNPLTQINMVLYTCPKEYRLKAFAMLLSKVLWKRGK